mmetsp:Transcript_70854/g.153885  ORF Transcript_70854/g.153885 Transcript_70854/m.153885 type:complete len:238 (+) Transcript_70854:485-1198(+)
MTSTKSAQGSTGPPFHLEWRRHALPEQHKAPTATAAKAGAPCWRNHPNARPATAQTMRQTNEVCNGHRASCATRPASRRPRPTPSRSRTPGRPRQVITAAAAKLSSRSSQLSRRLRGLVATETQKRLQASSAMTATSEGKETKTKAKPSLASMRLGSRQATAPSSPTTTATADWPGNLRIQAVPLLIAARSSATPQANPSASQFPATLAAQLCVAACRARSASLSLCCARCSSASAA